MYDDIHEYAINNDTLHEAWADARQDPLLGFALGLCLVCCLSGGLAVGGIAAKIVMTLVSLA